MNIEALRLRAERGEQQATAWRRTALFLLALLIAQTWLVVDTAMSLMQARQFAAQAEANAIEHGAAAAKAEGMFRTCRSANEGLFEGIKEQQVLLDEAIELAKRCRV
jgi:hypothetical protein